MFRGDGRIFRSAHLIDSKGERTNFLPLGGEFRLRIGLNADEPIERPAIGVCFDDMNGQRILTIHTPLSQVAIESIEGWCFVDCKIPGFPLAPGDYTVKLDIAARGEDELDCEERALHFTVVDGDAFGEGRGFRRGVCVAPSIWSRAPVVSGTPDCQN